MNGSLVQSYWSALDDAYIVSDGNAQYFYVDNGTLMIQGDQLSGCQNDTITIDQSANSDGVRVTMNGEVAEFDPGKITSVVIDTGEGNDTVNLENITGNIPVTVNLGYGHDTVNVTPTRRDLRSLTATSAVTINGAQPINGAASLDVMNIYDQNSSLDATYTVDNTSVSRPSIYSGFTQTVSYSHIGQLNLYTGSGTNYVNIMSVGVGSPVTVNLGGGTQTVNVSSTIRNYAASIFADVTVNPGAGYSKLNIDDQQSVSSRLWTINDGSITSNIAGAGAIHYGRLNEVVLNGGTNGTDNTFAVQNTTNRLITSIWGGYGDTVDVLGTGLLSTLNIDGYIDAVNIGNAGHTANIQGLVYVDTLRASVEVDDSADLVGQNDVVISPSSIIGLSDEGVIQFSDNVLTALSIEGSHGGSVYHVLGTQSYGSGDLAVTTLTCNGTDTVAVGDHGTLAAIEGDLYIENPSKFTTLTIDASADAASTTDGTITNAAVTGLSAGAIRFDQSALASLTITGRQGGNTYDVLSFPVYFLQPVTTTLNAFAGDTVNFGQHGSLQGAWGNGIFLCNLAGQGAAARVVLDGSLDPAGATYTIGREASAAFPL